ncbi:MAG: TlpA family protein disulfide reductase [Caldilineaceae bacterium]|nr:TlpA family protein disulfide reductase [Caldilineaceae bacterium]
MQRLNRWHFIFVAILFCGGAWLWWTQAPAVVEAEVRTPQPAVNHPAPDLTLPTLEGGTFHLADEMGKPVVLNFWATWCAPCRAEMPMLQSTWERYGDNVTIVGVDLDEDPAVVQAFVDELELTFPILLDDGAVIAERFNVSGLPTTLFIDGEGIIRQIYPGQLHSAILAEGIIDISQ